MASLSNSDDEEFTFDLLNNQNNNFENRLILENGTQTTSRAFNYYDATIKTACKSCPKTYKIDQEIDNLDSDTSDSSPLLLEKDIMEHCHAAVPAKRPQVAKAKRKLTIACGLCLIFITGEIAGGYFSGSLAIMSDAAHMFSDFTSFLISLLAIHLGTRKASKKYTFGLYRAEVIGALITVLIIWFVTGVLLYLACQRLVSGDFQVDPNPMIAVASCAVIFNIILGLLLNGQHHGHSHGSNSKHSHLIEENSEDHTSSEEHINIRAATIHVLGDLIQSIGVLISSVIIKIRPEYKNADPICTVLFSIIVVATTAKILRDTLNILLESNVESTKNYDSIFNDLSNMEHVVKVHDLHIWSLTTDQKILTVHLAVDSSIKGTSEKVLQEAIKMLRNKHKIAKATIQVEEYNPSIMNECDQCQFIN